MNRHDSNLRNCTKIHPAFESETGLHVSLERCCKYFQIMNKC
jgi:hypothetical protein